MRTSCGRPNRRENCRARRTVFRLSVGISGRTASIAIRSSGCAASMQLDFALNLHRNTKRQLREPHSTACVRPALRAENGNDEVGEPIDDCGLAIETGGRVDHPEYARPASDPVQAAKFSLQASEDGKPGEAGGNVRLFLGDFGANLAEREREAAVGVGGSVAGDKGARAHRAHPRKWQGDTVRELARLRQCVAKGGQAFFSSWLIGPGRGGSYSVCRRR